MTTDEDLVKTIENLRDSAARSVAFPNSPDDLNLWSVSRPLTEAMESHPDFGKSHSKFFLGRQIGFFPDHQSINLLRYAIENGPVEAIAWYRRVMATNSTTMRIVGQVFGLHVNKIYTFSNGLKLLPISELPDSPNSSSLKQPLHIVPGTQFPAAVMLELDGVEDRDISDGHEKFLEIRDVMSKTVNAFALSDGASPILTESWAEFADKELEAAEFGRGWHMRASEGGPPTHNINITAEALEWVEKFLQLTPEVGKACEVPLARLNMAKRRISPGDKAIDGSICLEALLSGRSRGELTHRLSLRVALLLGRSLEERQQIAKKVREFYQLRSDVVHGSVGKKEMRNREIADEGLELCLGALREIVNNREVPDPERWEFIGGPKWNRAAKDM